MYEYFHLIFSQVGLSIIFNTVLVVLASWGLYCFFPVKAFRGNTAPAFLVLAIWVGFLGVGLNVFYWRVLGEILKQTGTVTSAQLTYFGFYYGDYLWKGLGMVSIYLHFHARWLALPKGDRRSWPALLVAFYPNTNHWAYRTMKTITLKSYMENKRKRRQADADQT
jgi:hypothetical protein